jgi:prevent-host-death family protein
VSETIAQRDLRNDVSAVLARVARGESFTVTVRGEPVAELVPVRRPQRFVPRDRIVELLRGRPVDADLLTEVRNPADDLDEQGRDRVERLFCA